MLQPYVSMWAIQALSRLLATAGALLGLNVIIRPGWDDNPIYATALLLPGAPPTWGWIIFTCSIVVGLGHVLRSRTTVAFGHFLAAVWAFFFGLSILKSFFDYPTVPTGGAITYAAIALIQTLLGAAYFASRS